MSLYAFTTMRPKLAAKELQDAGFGGFYLLMQDRRHRQLPVNVERRHRHRAKGKASLQEVTKPKLRLAIPGYVFCYDPNPLAVSRMKHVRNGLRFVTGGGWQPLPRAEAEWVENPPRGIFRNTDIPRLTPREPVNVKPGDVVRFEMACEIIETPVIGVCDGQSLLVEIRALGRLVKTTVRADQVETVAA